MNDNESCEREWDLKIRKTWYWFRRERNQRHRVWELKCPNNSDVTHCTLRRDSFLLISTKTTLIRVFCRVLSRNHTWEWDPHTICTWTSRDRCRNGVKRSKGEALEEGYWNHSQNAEAKDNSFRGYQWIGLFGFEFQWRSLWTLFSFLFSSLHGDWGASSFFIIISLSLSLSFFIEKSIKLQHYCVFLFFFLTFSAY